jgi:uncharacterized protein YndB with AHSA1/START domain
MATPTVVHSTFVTERSYPKPPEVVFAAFADPAKKRRWFAEGHSHKVEEFAMDFRVGGVEVTRYRFTEESPFPGVALSTEGTIQDIVDGRRIVSASTMTLGERHISSSLVTVELVATESGTDLIFTHQGAFYEGSDGPEMREAGWKTLLDRLTTEVAG